MRDIYIYCLKCPVTKEVKYIGKTVDVSMRKRHHRSLNKKCNTNLEKWKQEIIVNNLKPIFEIVEVCDESNWEEREKYHITLHSNLLNMTLGGEGFHGDVSDNHMSVRTKGKKIEDVYSIEKCLEIKRKISNYSSGRKMGNNHHTDEYLRKQIVSNSKVHLLITDVIDNIEYEFINSKEAAIFFGVANSTIRNSKINGWLVRKRYLVRDLII